MLKERLGRCYRREDGSLGWSGKSGGGEAWASSDGIWIGGWLGEGVPIGSRLGEGAVLGLGHQPGWSRPKEEILGKLVISEPVFPTGSIFFLLELDYTVSTRTTQ